MNIFCIRKIRVICVFSEPIRIMVVIKIQEQVNLNLITRITGYRHGIFPARGKSKKG